MTDSMIVILDDNDEFRESVAWMLEGLGCAVRHSADHVQTLSCIENIPEETACCLLLDIRMPEVNGLEFHDELLRRGLTLPVIYMTAHGEVALAVQAMQKGALTFLEKPLDRTLLESAISDALSVESQRCRLTAKTREAAAQMQSRLATLTPRESQVLGLIMEDKTNKEIARAIEISLKTVEMHRSRVMKKLEARSAAQLVRMVYSHHEI